MSCRSALLAGAMSGRAAAKSERDDVRVDGFPAPRGLAQDRQPFETSGRGLAVARTIRLPTLGASMRVRHAVEARCAHVFAARGDGRALPAVRAWSRRTTSARGADLRSRFLAPYVRDEDGRVRRDDDPR
jgi:hypothetical protein